uniref:Uncharacterized protein n=1 Tax=Globodera rostochiensis TaxID=31243 RepID=A0A914HXL9_GLORO
MAMAMNSEQIVGKYTTKNRHVELPKGRPSTLASSLRHFQQPLDPFSRLSIVVPKVSPPPTSPGKWTLWNFECHDFSLHLHCNDPCLYCFALYKWRMFYKSFIYESKDRWESYLQKEKSFDEEQTLLDGLARFLPSKLAKDVFFNHKLGVGVFRRDIMPCNESADNSAGGVFQLLLLSTAGYRSAALLPKFDLLFLQTLRLIFDASSTVACHVNGLFYRCEINQGKGLEQEENPYRDVVDLPVIGKLEIWIDDRNQQKMLQESLINDINKLLAELEIPDSAFREFLFVIRVRDGLYLDYLPAEQ